MTEELTFECTAAVHHTSPAGRRAVKMTLTSGGESFPYYYAPDASGYQEALAKKYRLPPLDADIASLVGRFFMGKVLPHKTYRSVALTLAL